MKGNQGGNVLQGRPGTEHVGTGPRGAFRHEVIADDGDAVLPDHFIRQRQLSEIMEEPGMIKILQIAAAQVHKPAEHQGIGGRAHPVFDQRGVVMLDGFDEILNRVAIGQFFVTGGMGGFFIARIDPGFTSCC